jgi:CheY-like chemotaxis protein
MVKHTRTTGLTEEQAADSYDRVQKLEPIDPRATLTMASIDVEANISVPTAETGTAHAVKATMTEGIDKDERQDAPTTHTEAQPTRNLQTNPPNVMLVEDTWELAEVIIAALKRVNIDVVHESHGARALSRLTAFQPDIILLDIGLPDISGWQVLEGLKEHNKTANRPMPLVIIISAFGDPANRLVGKFQGVHNYLVKPFTAAEVERVVREAANNLSA